MTNKYKEPGSLSKLNDHPKVIVKFKDDVILPYEDNANRYLEGIGIFGWEKLFSGFGLNKLFRLTTQAQMKSLVLRARRFSPKYKPPNFFTYFRLNAPPGAHPEEIVPRLLNWSNRVQYAYVAPVDTEPQVGLNDPRYSGGCQGYLGPASGGGVDAELAWQFIGGDGFNQDFGDVERGWQIPHPDLGNVTLVNGCQNQFSDPQLHGANTLGVVCGIANNFTGGTGIAPNLRQVILTSRDCAGTTSDAIFASTSYLSKAGSVLLVEAQSNFLPVETWPDCFDVIEAAVAAGIVVIEPAGNGPMDLDTVTLFGENILKRDDSKFKESGAILVGAATSTPPHQCMPSSNFGSRVDCFAWGENVYAAGFDVGNSSTNCSDVNIFDGTSSASAIIAGVALAVQGIAEHKWGLRFKPIQLRDILKTGGTPCNLPADRPIGVMPNLAKVIPIVLSSAPQI